MEARPGIEAPTLPAGEKISDRKVTPEKVELPPRMAKMPSGTAVNGPSSSLPRLKISGIVWHEDSDKRRAVINGTFTSEGSVIEGMKVVEILPTQVRFLHQGRLLEISIFE
jgi:type II secretory pathway component PulC